MSVFQSNSLVMEQINTIASTDPHVCQALKNLWQLVSLEIRLHDSLRLWNSSEPAPLSKLLRSVDLWRQYVLETQGEVSNWFSLFFGDLIALLLAKISTLIKCSPFILKHFLVIYSPQDETEYRDKLSPIGISLNYSLDESTFSNGFAVNPVLNYYQESIVGEKVWVSPTYMLFIVNNQWCLSCCVASFIRCFFRVSAFLQFVLQEFNFFMMGS